MDKAKQLKKLSQAQQAYLQDMVTHIGEAEREHEVATLELGIATEKVEAAERIKNIVASSANQFVGYCAAEAGLPAADFAPVPTPGKWTFDQAQMAFVYMSEDAQVEDKGGGE